MSDRPDRRVEPTAPAHATAPLQTQVGLPGQGLPRDASREPAPRPPHRDAPAVATDGQLRATYAEYVVDPTMHEVWLRIRDAATDEVIGQIPSAEIAALNRSLREYADTLARHRAAAQGKAAS